MAGTETGLTLIDLMSGYAGGGGQRVISSTQGNSYDLWNPHKEAFDPTHLDVANRFGRSKLHPVLGFAISLLDDAREMTGEKMDFTTANPFKNAIAQRFIPILIQDVAKIAEMDPSLIPLSVLSGLGMSVQAYESR
jgi:hypothetical protein